MDSKQEKVVVTGLGCLTPLGNNIDEYWQNLCLAKSGISPITRFDTTNYRTKIGGEINLDVSEFVGFNVSNLSRNTQFSMAAANEALDDSGLSSLQLKDKNIGICIGSGLGGLYFYEESIKRLDKLGPRGISPISVPFVDPNSIVNQVAIKWGLTGQQFTISAACSSSAHAIGNALDMIRSGRVDAVLTGGVEATMSPLIFTGFDRLRAMSTRNAEPNIACQPFSSGRDGFVMSEGAGMLMLEKESHALERGANIYAVLEGYGATGGAYHMVKPKPEADDQISAMSLALKDAHIVPEQIDLISPHGTATSLNDESEYQALDQVFNASLKNIPVTPTKQMVGHMLGAAGAIEAIHVVKSIKESTITPMIYCDNSYDLNINKSKAYNTQINHALSNSFAFGNSNASLIFGAHI